MKIVVEETCAPVLIDLSTTTSFLEGEETAMVAHLDARLFSAERASKEKTIHLENLSCFGS